MKKANTMPIWAQWLTGLVVLGFAVAAGGISFLMNVRFGYQSNIGMAIVFGLSDIAKISLPIAILAMGSKQRLFTVTKYLCVALSILAALSYFFEKEAQRLKDAQAIAQAQSDARAAIHRVETQLAAISEPLTVEALTKLEKEKRAAADREAGRGGCGRNCEKLVAEADVILTRLGEAARRAKLEAELTAAKQASSANVEQAIGMADHVVALLGTDKATTATTLSIVISIATLIALELMAAFSGHGGALIGNAINAGRARRISRTIAPTTAKAEPAGDDGRMNEAEALAALQLLCWHAEGGKLISSNVKLAEQFNIPRQTFGDWMKKWRTSGLIITGRKGNATVYEALRKAA